MLDRRLAGGDGLRGLDLHRDVPDDLEAELASLVDQREVRLARRGPVRLQEVDAGVGELARGRASLVSIRDHPLVLVVALAVQDRPCAPDARPDTGAGLDLSAPRVELVEVSAEVADRGDPIGDELFERALALPAQVDVRVPEPRDQELAAPVDHLALGRAERDAAAADHDRLLGHDATADDVHHADVRDRKRRHAREM